MKNLSITLDELKVKYNENMQKPWNVNPADSNHSFGHDWYSTSVNSPLDGGIFKLVDEFCVIEFTDKYRQTHVGIITSVSYSTKLNGRALDFTVMSNYVGHFGTDPTNYGGFPLDGKKVKVIEGKLPDFKAIAQEFEINVKPQLV